MGNAIVGLSLSGARKSHDMGSFVKKGGHMYSDGGHETAMVPQVQFVPQASPEFLHLSCQLFFPCSFPAWLFFFGSLPPHQMPTLYLVP